MNIQNVAVIGAGTMGRKLAAIFAAAGFETVLEDVLPSNLRKAAQLLGEANAGEPGDERMHRRPRFASSIEDAVRTADLVVDCVPDELESKLEIFCLLDRMAPPLAVFATPTRSLSIADLASCTYRSDRCIAVEFASGELVEGEPLSIVGTSWTSPEVLDAVAKFWARAGFAVESKLDPLEASAAGGRVS